MGMSRYVYGFRPPDAKWHAMKTAYDSCMAANVPVPREISQFFEDGTPDAAGVKVNIDAAISDDWSGQREMEEGIEVDLSKLPKDVKIIRFVNSY